METFDDADGFESEGFGISAWLRSVGGVLFFVAGFLAWWQIELPNGVTFTNNAFDYPLTGTVPYLIFVAIAILTIVIESESLDLPPILVHPFLLLAAALVGTVLVVIRSFSAGSELDVGDGSALSRSMGLYLAIVAALVVLAGCVIGARDAWVDEEDEDTDVAIEEFFDDGSDAHVQPLPQRDEPGPGDPSATPPVG